MHSVTIDAGVLAVPALQSAIEDAYCYVETLLDWKRLLDHPWISIYMSERASEALISSTLFPLRNNLTSLFKNKNIVEYDVNTVASVADRLLQLTPSLEEKFQINDILMEDLETEPALNSLTVSEDLISELGRCLVIVSIMRDKCSNPVTNHTMVLKTGSDSGFIRLRSLIHMLDSQRDDLADLSELPQTLEGIVPVCKDFRGLMQSIDEHGLWNLLEESEMKETVVRIALYKSRIQRGLEPDWDKLPPFRFGHRFVNIADEVCSIKISDLVPKLIRSIVETLEQINLHAVHALRVNDSGGSPQRIRASDNAKAMRRDIDYEYHLHYWECNCGLIEFASMGPHNDFRIPE
jgi:hypothetical protein